MDFQTDSSNGEAAERSEAASGAFPETKRVPLYKPLTKQEIRVVELIADGITYRRIAEIMGISLRTVRFYAETAGLKIPGNLPTKTRIMLWFHGSRELFRR